MFKVWNLDSYCILFYLTVDFSCSGHFVSYGKVACHEPLNM